MQRSWLPGEAWLKIIEHMLLDEGVMPAAPVRLPAVRMLLRDLLLTILNHDDRRMRQLVENGGVRLLDRRPQRD